MQNDDRGNWPLEQFDALIAQNKRDFDTRFAKARVLMAEGEWAARALVCLPSQSGGHHPEREGAEHLRAQQARHVAIAQEGAGVHPRRVSERRRAARWATLRVE